MCLFSSAEQNSRKCSVVSLTNYKFKCEVFCVVIMELSIEMLNIKFIGLCYYQK